MTNPQIQKIIYQNQCFYWYWSIFLNLLSIGNLFLGWDGEKIKLFQWDGDKFVLRFSAAEKNEVEWKNKDDLKWTKKEGLEERTEEDIRIESEHPDLKQPVKPVDGLILPKKRFGKVPLIIQASSKKSSTRPEKELPDETKNYKSPQRKLLVFFV